MLIGTVCLFSPCTCCTHTLCGVGGDDEKVLVWRVADIMRGVNRSVAMETPHCSNIFSATFSCDNSYIYSGGKSRDLEVHNVPRSHDLLVCHMIQ